MTGYRKFTTLRAERYMFQEKSGGERPVIAFKAGNKLLGFIEYGSPLIRLANELIDLDDENDRLADGQDHE